MRSEGFYVNKKSTDASWDRTSDLSVCSVSVLITPNFHTYFRYGFFMYVMKARRDPEVWVNLILYLRTRGWKTSRDSSVGIATGYGLDVPGSNPGGRQYFPHLSSPSLGATQPPVQ